MRILIGLLALAGLVACGPETPGRAASDKVVEGDANPGASWPLLLQHCLRSSSCNPSNDFGKGEEQASGLAGSVAWFAETDKRVAEGAQDYGAAITLTPHGRPGLEPRSAVDVEVPTASGHPYAAGIVTP